MPATLSSVSTINTAAERIQEEAALWFARLHSEEVLDTERAAFNAWLDADARHRHEYDLLEQLWDASSQLRPGAKETPRRRRAMRAAAGLAGIALVCGWMGWAWLDGRVATDPGELRHVRLADGSELDIAPNTRLRVKFDSGRRRLELEEGRIVVSVATDHLRPFEVAAGGGIVRDIGTRFEVDVGRKRTRVVVAEGLVEIDLQAAGSAPRKVGAGEVAEFDDRFVSPAQLVDAAATLAWSKGQLVFDAAPLAEVVRALNNYRRTPIELADPSLRDIRISGVFLIDDENAALRALESVAPVEFVTEGARVFARTKG
ncbi:MAG: FecR domain-containing protein [Dechloromonas sp.]|nr:FecR domain-containing protein [Dechloromonas sp.]